MKLLSNFTRIVSLSALVGVGCGEDDSNPNDEFGPRQGGAANAGLGGAGGNPPPAGDAGAPIGGGNARGGVGGGLGGTNSGGGGAPDGIGGLSGAGNIDCDAHGPAETPVAFAHPGALHKLSDLERMRYQVAAGIEPWATSFRTLSANARARFDYTVRGTPGLTSVERGGTNGPEFESDVTAAYLNALMWAITEDERHAAKCVEIFEAWSALTAVVGGGTEALNAGLYAWKLVEAAEIIRSTYSGWTDEAFQAFASMLVHPGYSSSSVPETLSATNGTFYWRTYDGDPGRHGNQDMIAWRAVLGMGVLLDNRTMYDRALRYFKGLLHRSDDLPYASGPSTSGSQTADNPYFTTFTQVRATSTPDYGYNGVLEHYIWETGQTQESSRDQQHAMLGLGVAAGIAEVAWNQGDPVYNALDHRLLKGFEFSARYNASFIATFPDQPEPWEPAEGEFLVRTDRTGRWRSKAVNPHFESDFEAISRGDFPGKRPIFEQALAHFETRMGLDEDALWTRRARDVALSLAGHEGVGFSLDHPGFGALTFRRPPRCAGDPLHGYDANGVPIYGIPVLPTTLEAEHYDHFPMRGEGRTYHDTSSGNERGAFRRDDVDIRCQNGALVVTNLEADEWLTYTVFVPEDGEYSVEVRYVSSSETGSLRVEFGDPAQTAEAVLASTGASREWSTALLAQDLALKAGVQALRLVVLENTGELEIDSLTIRR